MESPSLSLSRTASASFAPGSHRRSHPNLQHLSLAPLTPRYPIDPADYDAYFDPATSELHTSRSISHISSLPSPVGILTNSPVRSRANSRTRLKRKNKSTVSIRAPTDAPDTSSASAAATLAPPSGALTSEGFGYTQKKSSIRLHRADSSWLVHTGLALTEGSRETKGQSWIGKRDSSTSLHTATPMTQSISLGEGDRLFRSGRTTPTNTRSRTSSRRRSRRNLAMTPAERTISVDESVTPDWADKETQAEIAARVEKELVDELDEDDPYGMLNFESQIELDFDSEDEEEVRKVISGYGMGRWMDGIIDVFLHLDEEFPEGETEREKTTPRELEDGKIADVEGGPSRGPETRSEGNAMDELSDGPVEPPPERPKGLWDDVAWFGRLIARSIQS